MQIAERWPSICPILCRLSDARMIQLGPAFVKKGHHNNKMRSSSSKISSSKILQCVRHGRMKNISNPNLEQKALSVSNLCRNGQGCAVNILSNRLGLICTFTWVSHCSKYNMCGSPDDVRFFKPSLHKKPVLFTIHL